MRTFCCCLPTRLGVLILSPITFAGSLVVAGALIWALVHELNSFTTVQRIFTGALAGEMTLLCLASLFGFIGSIFASYGAVRFYSSMLWSIWLFALAIGIVEFVFLFKDKDQYIDNCTSSAENIDLDGSSINLVSSSTTATVSEDACKSAFNIVAGVSIGVWAFVLIIAAYLCVIVARYRDQLREERGGFRKVSRAEMGESGGFYRNRQ